MDAQTARKIHELERKIERLSAIEHGSSIGDVYGAFRALPYVRAYWPMSDYYLNLKDHSVHGNNLTGVSPSPIRYTSNGLFTYTTYDGVSQYFYMLDSGAIEPGAYGTFGGWFYPQDFSYTQGLFAKWNSSTANDRSWMIWNASTSNVLEFTVSGDGINRVWTDLSNIPLNQWIFIVARMHSSVSIKLNLFSKYDTRESSNTTSIPATLYNGNAELRVGHASSTSTTTPYKGYISNLFFCTSEMTDRIIENLFSISRVFYGV